MIEQHGNLEDVDLFYTNTLYWDCECKTNYIHLTKKGNYCPKCDSWCDESPDARVNEIKEMYDPKKDCAVNKRR
jgi:hypothetical protein